MNCERSLPFPNVSYQINRGLQMISRLSKEWEHIEPTRTRLGNLMYFVSAAYHRAIHNMARQPVIDDSLPIPHLKLWRLSAL